MVQIDGVSDFPLLYSGGTQIPISTFLEIIGSSLEPGNSFEIKISERMDMPVLPQG